MTLDNILEEIKKANTIAIVVHENPDGDAIGSALAMKLALEQLNKDADVIIPEYPSAFSFLPGVEKIKKESDIQEYDLAIALDCASIKLLNGFAKYFDKSVKNPDLICSRIRKISGQEEWEDYYKNVD